MLQEKVPDEDEFHLSSIGTIKYYTSAWIILRNFTKRIIGCDLLMTDINRAYGIAR